ncbi:hypothetical protein BC938DRAFT_474639 [Jimgerdemannia flammicorona]|uniref:Peptidase M1 membrane alanine aminopeptidase domain-containing protein n=1 Tax=Jimgerdemannia flammicorona TaxID=994334 RepID=A0A433QS93_9FUNG|nr:hypothetical protein BC938DRAFT_474639 [Jimgerdemannia flammicorona]
MPRALTLDALRSSHPIEVAVGEAEEIRQIFDAISYTKGASVIRMLSSWLGVDVFLAGIRRYLHRHKYQNAKTLDLWNALSEEAGVDVGVFMHLWTKRVGYPVVDVVSLDEVTIEVRQSRYLSTGDVAESEDETTWWIPLNIASSPSALTLTDKTNTFKLSSSVFKLNARQTGLYRVNYSIDILKTLAEEIKKGKDGILSDPTDRIGLLSDAASLSVSGQKKTSGLLELLRAFEKEENYFLSLFRHDLLLLTDWLIHSSDLQRMVQNFRNFVEYLVCLVRTTYGGSRRLEGSSPALI